MNHDIVTIGGSAGALDVLFETVRELPADLNASVFVVVHMPAGYVSSLPELLASRGPLPAHHPVHGEPIEPATIYVAPPDMHVQVRRGTIEVVRGPKENGVRPAADVLFRTAAAAYGSRVIGVVLTGYQDCGTAGMMSIKARGGLAVVQDPQTAVAPEMPQHVIAQVPVDHVVHPAELPGLLTRLVAERAQLSQDPDPFVQQIEGSSPGSPADVVCPICNGVLTEAQPGLFQHFRCHVGHAFTLDSLAREQSDQMDRALWAAVRALEESAALCRRMSARESGEMKQRLAEKARTQQQQADYIRNLALHGALLAPDDARHA